MAARRVTGTALDWAKFAEKIPASQKASFQAFKQKHDGYLRAVNSLPEQAPKIDFAAYKNKIAVAGMVEDFQKKYEALDIPYPKDTISSSIDQQGAQKKSEYEKMVADSKAKIATINSELAKWEAMMPVEEMNREEALMYLPDHPLVRKNVPNPNNPRFYPHDQDYADWEAETKIKLAERGDHH